MDIRESFLRAPKAVINLEKEQLEQMVSLPVRSVMSGVNRALGVIRETSSLVRPSQSQREFARALAAEHAMKKAAQAAEIVEIGQQSGISDIIFTGRAALASIVIAAKQSPVIDRRIRTEIVSMAKQLEVDTEFEPLLTDEEQLAYKEACKQYDNVFDISTYRQNAI